MLLKQIDGFLWLLLLLGPFLFFQRQLHREVQSVFLLLTRRPEISIMLFSLLFLPGVFLHEASHYLVARLLGVRTGNVSLIPAAQPDGRLQLGYVETTSTDFLRDAFIGAAPLLAGGVFVALAGIQMGVLRIWTVLAQPADVWQALSYLFNQPDFWLWFYLTFTISSTMMPSASDRRAWLPLSVVGVGLFGISLLAGGGPWLAANLAVPLNQGLRVVGVVFGIALAVHLVLFLPVLFLRRLLNKLTGLVVA